MTGQHPPVRIVERDEPDNDYALLSRRDVDDLRQTVSGLNMTMVRVDQAVRELTKVMLLVSQQQAEKQAPAVPAVQLEPGMY